MKIEIVERQNNGKTEITEMTEAKFREYAAAVFPDKDWTVDIHEAAGIFGESFSDPARQTTTVHVYER